jgi:hypothetical protein
VKSAIAASRMRARAVRSLSLLTRVAYYTRV